MNKSIFKNTLLGLGGVVVSFSPLITAVSCGTDSNATGFDKNKIGVYVEQSWVETFNKAKKEYEKVSGRTEIQFLINNVFDGMGLIDTLGFQDQKVADLIYMPLDRIPVLSQDKKALMAFESVEALTSGMEDSIFDTNGNGIAEESEKQEFANLGKGVVNGRNAYFAFNHNVESLIAFTKGTATNAKTLEEVFQSTDADKWADSMFSTAFYDLWPSLGFVAGFLESNDGIAVGKSLISYNETTKKYESDMAKISETNPTGNVLKLKEAVTFIASTINSAALSGQDWMALGGDIFFSKTESLFKEKSNSFIIDGPWNKNKWMSEGVDVKSIPEIKTGKKFIQAPGGWVYGINARNSTNAKKVADMKDFMDILLTDKEVVSSQYKSMGKVIAGAEAKKILEDKTNITEVFDQKILEAVYAGAANSMNSRPDNGNSSFMNVWAAWDESGFRDKATQDQLRSKNFDVNLVISSIAKSFENVLLRLNKK
ncbi:MAG: hypothetical protein KFW07_02365 [Mycoplasmataceae bacterium]|nr:hypothetical protein [Mycoplasmataceae bacterium]